MKNYLFLFIGLIALMVACDPRSMDFNKKEIIARPVMVRLMADVQITETALREKQSTLKGDTLKIISERAYDSLYLFYKTTPQAFQNSLKYYQQDLNDYLEMTEEMITILTQKQDSIKLEGDSTLKTKSEDSIKPVIKEKENNTSGNKPEIKEVKRK
ncbi:MAG TPA: DUF4296 domain-containing protein [Lentimicrobium sp.]|nr:DUF4296 domain-containing protein [Lentimicrobium sp.]